MERSALERLCAVGLCIGAVVSLWGENIYGLLFIIILTILFHAERIRPKDEGE